MSDYVNVYDLNMGKMAVLENAFNITETHKINSVYELSFSLPNTDEKNKWCRPYWYARYTDSGQLYRITDVSTRESDTGITTYKCEHVIATLADIVLFGAYTYGGRGINTTNTINWLLSKQAVKNWVLDQCDFSRQFEYGWEQENILNALFSVPKEFSNDYIWDYDTTVYPWKLRLLKIDTDKNPDYYIRAEKNLLSMDGGASHLEIATRIYALGYGEGVNQLTIKGAKYSDGRICDKHYVENAAAINEYGLHEKVLVDRRYENADSLLGYAQKTLDALSVPQYTRTFDVVDLYPMTKDNMDNAKVGGIVRFTVDNSVAFITKVTRRHDSAGDMSIELSTKSGSITDTIADLAERVRIESVYAQGATQLYQHSLDANATPSKGLPLKLYFPNEMVQINKVLLKIELGKFRAYSQATSSGGGSTQTSSGGSASGSTSQSTGGGGTSVSVSMGDSTSTSTAQWTKGSDLVSSATYLYGTLSGTSSVKVMNAAGNTSHTHTIGRSDFAHSHNMSHTHYVNVSGGGSHSHSFNIGGHTHSMTIPNHSHDITAGIYEKGNPKSFDIYVNGQFKTKINGNKYDGDITEWLISNGTIPRNSWVNVEIRPDDLAYVSSSVFVQGFVQSRGGGNY